tara:strand:- start:1917 stop:2426 length:510 start_codon:yes stop_codon:yes gene_type:complete
MNLEMKNIQHSEFASEETYCYQGSVYLDGKPFALVKNDGHGGCDYQYSHNKFKGEPKEYHEAMKKVNEYFKSLPKRDVGKYDWAPEGFDESFEGWCHEQVTNFLITRDVKRALKKNKVVYQKKDDGTMGLFDYNINANSIIIKNKIPESVILNDLPIDEAVKIWRGYFG